MEVIQVKLANQEEVTEQISKLPENSDLYLIFGNTDTLKSIKFIQSLLDLSSDAIIAGCSTSGEILGTSIYDQTIVINAFKFNNTKIQSFTAKNEKSEDSFKTGQVLAEQLKAKHLKHVLVLSNGLFVNGTELVNGLTKELPKEVTITGGLAGDGERFNETFVVTNSGIHEDYVQAVGFYGESLQVSFGALGGWDAFGPERVITKSEGNVLYSMDGHPALELYRKYLGDYAEELPASGLLFPLSIKEGGSFYRKVRTILSVDEGENSITFAGNIPEGATARLMRANVDRLIDGAQDAANISYKAIDSSNPDFVLTISCVGRRMVLQQRSEEELDAVQNIFPDTVISGFYSYGEISPLQSNVKCELHNQTMAITTLTEL